MLNLEIFREKLMSGEAHPKILGNNLCLHWDEKKTSQNNHGENLGSFSSPLQLFLTPSLWQGFEKLFLEIIIRQLQKN